MSEELPNAPVGPEQTYLARIAGQNVDLPKEPVGPVQVYLNYIAKHGGGGGGGSSDYDDLFDKPKINNVTLSGNKTSSALGLQAALVSGTNIKTINGSSILASGNLALKPEIPVVSTQETTLTLDPNKFYSFGEVGSLTLTLNTPADATIYNEYMFEFDSGTTPTTLNLPNTVTFPSTPTIEANKTYQVSILNNIGLIVGV